MSFVKLNGGAGAVLVALAVLVASSQAALAETTKLICNMGDQRVGYWQEKMNQQPPN